MFLEAWAVCHVRRKWNSNTHVWNDMDRHSHQIICYFLNVESGIVDVRWLAIDRTHKMSNIFTGQARQSRGELELIDEGWL